MSNLSVGRSRPSAVRLALAVLLAAGCNCGTSAFQSRIPKISVDPNPVVVTNAITGQAGHVTLNVHNPGLGPLSIPALRGGSTTLQNPYIVNATPGVQYALTDVLNHDCSGGTLAAGNTEIPPGGCAQVTLQFQPSANGMYTATLRFESNAVAESPYDVPITITSATPHIKACAFDGMNMLGCNQDGQPLGLDFGAVASGATATRTVQLISDGSAAVQVSSYQFTGNSDFTISPAPEGFTGLSLAPQQTSSFTVTFAPKIGGPRTAQATYATSDPLNAMLPVNIKGTGNGPGLCFCIGSDQQTCENTDPSINFKQVAPGATASTNLFLTSCGTDPLTFSNAMLTDSTPSSYAVMNLPTANAVLPPGSTIIVPVNFTPPSLNQFDGSINLQTADGESLFIPLSGQGAQISCVLSVASTTVDFGQVAAGQMGTQSLVVANTGKEACVFSPPPQINMGGTLFSVGNAPTQPLQPARTTSLTLTYMPTATSGTDTGNLLISYTPESAPTGTTPSTLKIDLKGEPVAKGVCQLTAVPDSSSAFGRTLNFGGVQVNASSSLAVILRNVGSAPCAITNAVIDPGMTQPGFGGADAFKLLGQPSAMLAPGASTTVQVKFTPTAAMMYGSPLPGSGGPATGGPSLQITTSDTTSFDGTTCGPSGMPGAPGCVGWVLSGEGILSNLRALPSAIDFGDVTLSCQSVEKSVTLYNIGQTDIHITGFSMDPAPPPTVFTVIAPPASMAVPITLQSGKEIVISIRYTPTQLGVQTATLYIGSDAASGMSGTNNPYTAVTLTGTGTTDSSTTDTFNQADHPIADVLWVIDMDANSMKDKQQQISNNAQAFIQAAEAAGTDFHLGVIASNPASTGGVTSSNYPNVTVYPSQLFNACPTLGPGCTAAIPQAWVSSSDPNPTEEFAENALIGTSDEGGGGGMEAMYEALTDPNLSGANAGFLRDQARLVVISISDDDDWSPQPPDFYAAFLQSLKPNSPQSVVFDVVGGPLPTAAQPNGCPDPNGDGFDDPPVLYAQLAQLTGGKLYSMCPPNPMWSQIAADLSLGSFGGQTHFVLSRTCDPSTLTVTVDGVVQRPGTDYTFDAVRNAINFTTAPAATATIVATYDAVCM